ncbi:hypothetical protein CK203_046678 [Vitis vinifera]|uniref:Uncharacterized protein n=1 Tax=Vitis vinifera TaxID=29760 RepID=A0A438HJV4_VITVI|nr:hypothetical protein CK203_046678 [Vitis vinifera]
MFSQSQPSPTTPIIGTGSIAQKAPVLKSIRSELPMGHYPWWLELDSEKMIVNAKECVRLYILKIDDSLEEQTQNASCVFTPTLVNQSNRDFYLSR